MRRDNPTGLQQRTEEYRAHPVPQRAKALKHIALHFPPNGDIAWELTRHLTAKARSRLISR